MQSVDPVFSEEQYWRDYEIIKNDVNAAITVYHTHKALNTVAAADIEVHQRINRHPEFWIATSFSLQTSLFIVLARILDPHPSVHSIYQVLKTTTAHPELFSRAALRARKLSIEGSRWETDHLDAYIARSWAPTTDDLRSLRKALAPHKAKFDEICKPLRDKVFAHIVLRDHALVSDLFSRALKADIERILCFLYSLLRAIWEIAFNACRPDLNGHGYAYEKRVSEIASNTERLLRELP